MLLTLSANCKNCNKPITQRLNGRYVHSASGTYNCNGRDKNTAEPNTEETTMPEPTITDEQRAAYQRITGVPGALPVPAGVTIDSDIALLLPLLPDALTRAPLPKEPGAYNDAEGTTILLDPKGEWRGVYGDIINIDLCPQPFVKLVEQKELVTVAPGVLEDVYNNAVGGNVRSWQAVADYVNTKVRGDA